MIEDRQGRRHLATPAAQAMTPSAQAATPAAHEVTDEELDAYIRARLVLLGVDLSVLPEQDDGAPADQARIMASARRFLRTTPGAIAAFPLDALGPAPAIYPAELSAWTGNGRTDP